MDCWFKTSLGYLNSRASLAAADPVSKEERGGSVEHRVVAQLVDSFSSMY